MATLGLGSRMDSRQVAAHATPRSFRIDLWGAVSAVALAGGFATAMIVCFQHGDVAAIPGLAVLALMACVVVSIHVPPNADSASRKNGRRPVFRTHLLRRHSLSQ